MRLLLAVAARAVSDQIFADGFDGPKWYVDADSDTYGNPAVFVRSASQPPGYVANALDCDDTSAAIHPGATDDPDASFADSNCDGIDGDIAKAIFVAPSGTDSPTCGTQVSPCHSPAFAIGRLSAQRTQIYVQVGVYSGALTVGANAAFYGGYDVAWQRGPVTAGGPNARFAGSIAAMGTHGAQAYSVYVPGGIQAVLADLEIDGPDTNATSNGNGANSYALYADQNANVQLSRDRILAGAAADGVAGNPGVDAAQGVIVAGGAGDPGMEYNIACDATSHGVGGPASTNTCANGRSVVAGKGGDGGTMDTSCGAIGCTVGGDCTAKPGTTGTSAAVTVGTIGTGGAGGSGSDSCGPTQPGFAGAVSDGSGGLKGLGSLLIDAQWVADAGGGGSLGDNGGGGGGGGGAGGCDIGTDSYGAGGGGGGVGGCAATGAGSGGGGGGGSFAVFAYSASVTVASSVVSLGGGGNGGNGGVAGQGQPGGVGGPGGLPFSGDSKNGGKGGDGGRGGVAGGGGGGQGGSAYGIYSYSSTVTSNGNSFVGGTAGSGGSGGASVAGPGAGQDGQSGIVANVGICIAPAACD